jgi:hypothetical protein
MSHRADAFGIFAGGARRVPGWFPNYEHGQVLYSHVQETSPEEQAATLDWWWRQSAAIAAERDRWRSVAEQLGNDAAGWRQSAIKAKSEVDKLKEACESRTRVDPPAADTKWECPACDGHGVDNYHNGNHCRKCHGTGDVPIPAAAPKPPRDISVQQHVYGNWQEEPTTYRPVDLKGLMDAMDLVPSLPARDWRREVARAAARYCGREVME